MSAPTPGPWTAQQVGLDFEVLGSDETRVACNLDRDDAALIAAAPDLLEALERLHGWYSASHIHGGLQAPCGECAQLAAARAAIAEARGAK